MTPEALRHDWAILGYAARSAEVASLRKSATATAAAQAQRAAAGEGAGLVPFKTSLQDTFSVNIAPTAVAERRVKRLKRSVWASGHLHAMTDNGFRAPQCWFVTLTYKGVDDWKPDHISAAIQKFRTWARSFGYKVRYTWVAELQQRGAVHYHILFWLPHGVRMPQWDRPFKLASGRVREAFWPHGMTNTEKALSGVGYLMKYLSKLGEQTRFPKGLRLYGIGGLTGQARAVRSWYNLPEWVKREYGVGEVSRKFGGLLVHATGELLEPMYTVVRGVEELRLKLLRELAPKFHDGAYSMLRAA